MAIDDNLSHKGNTPFCQKPAFCKKVSSAIKIKKRRIFITMTIFGTVFRYFCTTNTNQNVKIMAKFNLCEGLIAQMLEDEAWKNISGRFPFSEEQLEKVKDKVDWEELSGNNNICWTVKMLEKFQDRIHWDVLARMYDPQGMPEDILSKFKDKWDWDEYSDNGTLTDSIIEKYADQLNWKKLINNWHLDRDKINLSEFISKYQDRIPSSDFKDSRLWNELVEEKGDEIRKAICNNQI